MDAEEPVNIERITLLKIPLDIVSQEQLPEVISGLIKARAGGNIVLLSVWDLLRARRDREYRTFIQGASLVIPISKSLVDGARFLTGKTPIRYMPFNFVISLLSILEKGEYSCYLLGGRKQILRKTEKNIRQTFPSLRIVGRFPQGWKRSEEATLLEAIRKAAPSLLLAGKGIRGEERWIVRNSSILNQGFRLWCSDLFEVFAEKKKRPSPGVFNRGFEWLGYCFRQPLKFFRVFLYLYYRFLLIIYRLFVRERAK
ncbi:MAG: WecB/TagA/CpsF family glycosyltransferase [Treponema sp.]|jgi:N-acetylglucosaminyldiphosphoundecaprenol N-acetyl-beta-D-mannosaminyltransferase|nr:WecB/TagA/CpsF family glycosyltransferase [Treponema sp.]